MTKDTTSSLTWHHGAFGSRVMKAEPPYFVISEPSDSQDRDVLRRRALTDLAGPEPQVAGKS
jgi:hypothetical protein